MLICKEHALRDNRRSGHRANNSGIATSQANHGDGLEPDWLAGSLQSDELPDVVGPVSEDCLPIHLQVPVGSSEKNRNALSGKMIPEPDRAKLCRHSLDLRSACCLQVCSLDAATIFENQNNSFSDVVNHSLRKLVNYDKGPQTHVKACHESLYRPIESGWRVMDQKMIVNVEIPANTMATVRLPNAKLADVKESGKQLDSSEAISNAIQDGDAVVMQVASGRYSFEYPWKN